MALSGRRTGSAQRLPVGLAAGARPIGRIHDRRTPVAVARTRPAAGPEVPQRLQLHHRRDAPLLDGWEVRPLFSPPYTPEYNGATEAGNGALKTRTSRRLVRAVPATGPQTTPKRHDAWPTNSTTLMVRWGQRRKRPSSLDCPSPSRPAPRSVEPSNTSKPKSGFGCALVEHGFLTFTRRSIAPPIPSRTWLRISYAAQASDRCIRQCE